MSARLRLVSLRENGIVEFEYVPGGKVMIWYGALGRWHMSHRGVMVDYVSQEKLADLHAQAIAYGNLMGTCEGFPEQVIEI